MLVAVIIITLPSLNLMRADEKLKNDHEIAHADL